MKFYSPYFTTFDRQYDSAASSYEGSPLTTTPEAALFGVGDLGKTIIDGRDQGTFVQSVGRAIREGSGKLELQPAMEGESFGAGVENYSKEMRKDIKQLAEFNKVELQSVHTPVQIGNVAGLGEGGFSESQRENQLNEIKKHIDFAGDVTKGASIVVHTGEFPRAISETWGKQGFETFPGEKEEATFFLVDKRTGNFVREGIIKKSEKVIQPVWLTKKDSEGNDYYVDEEGNPVTIRDRRPKYESSSGTFETREVGWNEFEKYAKEYNEYAEQHKEEKLTPITTQEAFYRAQIEAQEKTARGWALNYGKDYDKDIEALKKLKSEKEYYAKIEEKMSESEKMGFKREVPIGPLGRKELKLPSEIVAEQIDQVEQNIDYKKEAALAQQMQAATLKRAAESIVPIEDFAKERSMKSLAELGEYAMHVSKEKKTEKPLFIVPENVFPHMGYGSHPEELIELVEGARDVMVKDLKNSGIEEDRAKKLAEQHIKATLDTQHLGMWKRHFIREEGESDKKFDERFNKWYMDEVKKMHKAGIIGNIHIVDGFGRGHTHVVAGGGTMPVVEAVSWLKEHGYNENMISEAHGNLPVMMTGTWEAFGAGIYGGRKGELWTDVQNSYFGRNAPPNYVVGDYRPSEDWTFWSGVPLE
jgi:hypothetical protein